MSRDPDGYTALVNGPQVELKIRGSRFLGQSWAAEEPSTADQLLGSHRRRYHDATHHCYAWRIGIEQPASRYDDDGEPTGTAGPPILAPLEREDLRNALVVVTRYYGGTKLGTGGLARAYGEAAREALAASAREVRFHEERLVFSCGFEQVGAVEPLLARQGEALLAVQRDFDPQPKFSLVVKRSRTEPLWSQLVEATAGRVQRLSHDPAKPSPA